jgi:hypothetical protein
MKNPTALKWTTVILLALSLFLGLQQAYRQGSALLEDTRAAEAAQRPGEVADNELPLDPGHQVDTSYRGFSLGLSLVAVGSQVVGLVMILRGRRGFFPWLVVAAGCLVLNGFVLWRNMPPGMGGSELYAEVVRGLLVGIVGTFLAVEMRPATAEAGKNR